MAVGSKRVLVKYLLASYAISDGFPNVIHCKFTVAHRLRASLQRWIVGKKEDCKTDGLHRTTWVQWFHMHKMNEKHSLCSFEAAFLIHRKTLMNFLNTLSVTNPMVRAAGCRSATQLQHRLMQTLGQLDGIDIL